MITETNDRQKGDPIIRGKKKSNFWHLFISCFDIMIDHHFFNKFYLFRKSEMKIMIGPLPMINLL